MRDRTRFPYTGRGKPLRIPEVGNFDRARNLDNSDGDISIHGSIEPLRCQSHRVLGQIRCSVKGFPQAPDGGHRSSGGPAWRAP